MPARARTEAKGPVERLHERIVAGDRGWFFAQIADRVSELPLREPHGGAPRIDTLLRIAEALDCDLSVELVPRK